MWRSCLFVLILFAFACGSQPESKYPVVVIETKAGNIEVELYNDKAPQTVAGFLSSIDSGLYNNSTFYRVLTTDNQPTDAFKATLIQGGLWRTNRKRAAGKKGIPHESTAQTGILHKRGIVSFARMEPGTATTEFFICLNDQPGFDFGGENNADKQGYAAFGRVIKGMDVVEYIYNRPEYEQLFNPPVSIFDIKRK